MSQELEFGHKVCKTLDRGTVALGSDTTARLFEIRQQALSRYQPVAGLSLAGFGRITSSPLGYARGLLAALALTVGAVGSYYWNTLDQAVEHAEIDSALLADEVPFNAYIDQGFMAWLEELKDSADSDESSPQ
jgi:hypothetical protein